MNEKDSPKITQLKSYLSYSLNPFTGTPLGYVNIIFKNRILCELDRNTLFDEQTWTHEFTEMSIYELIERYCERPYLLCRCDQDCGIPIYWTGGNLEIKLPIPHFIASIVTSCNLPTKNGYEKVDGEGLWELALKIRDLENNSQ